MSRYPFSLQHFWLPKNNHILLPLALEDQFWLNLSYNNNNNNNLRSGENTPLYLLENITIRFRIDKYILNDTPLHLPKNGENAL